MDLHSKKISRLFLLPLLFCFICQHLKAQRFREIIIVKDTVQEFNKNPSIIEETYVEDGVKIIVVDSLNKLISIASYKDNKLNGQYFSFFIDVNMLEERGEYKANKKHGRWYFWNRNGVLLRTEVWRDDKLISKKTMVKTK